MVVCSVCGNNETTPDAGFCTQCGNKFDIISPPPPPPQSTPPPPPPPTQQQSAPPPPQSAPLAHLRLPDNSVIQLDKQQKALGRLELLNCIKSIQGADPMTISRQHFTIHYENDKYFIEDGTTTVQEKASINHTYLNGADITSKGKQELKDGDTIDVANTIKVVFKNS